MDPSSDRHELPFHGFLFPVKNCGNFIGKITASFKASFAPSRPKKVQKNRKNE